MKVPTKKALADLRWLAVAAALLLIGLVVWTSRDPSTDDAIAERLLDRQKRLVGGASSNSSGSIDREDEVRLARNLIARLASDRRTWQVEKLGRPGRLELPFQPGNDMSPPAFVATPAFVDSGGSPAEASNEMGFIGPDVCAECHAQNHQGFLHTAHAKTSGPFTTDVMHGKLGENESRVASANPELAVSVVRVDDGFGQQIDFADWSQTLPTPVVVGSAKAGQSYLFWSEDALFQAYVSFLSDAKKWIISPGFNDQRVSFTRSIRTGCLECHVTFIQRTAKPNHYDRDSAIWGVSCERCHGPAEQHVRFHRDHPDGKTAHKIINPDSLSREKQLEVCGQCHQGSFSLQKDAFTYRPGMDLGEFHRSVSTTVDGGGGIHTSNQLNRLTQSKCFEQSQMTCTTCHDPHQNQRGRTDLFTAVCLECHGAADCGLFNQLGERIADDCVSCHMPRSENQDMLDVADEGLNVQMADHFIRVDRPATDRHLERVPID